MQPTGPKVTKVCRICNLDKGIHDFYSHKETKDKLRSECKSCWSKATVKYYIDNKSILAEKRKNYHFITRYGLSKDEVESFKQEQNNTCPICLKHSELVVDHCHVTGKVRSLLCNKCNQALGSLNENIDNFKRAINYLEKYNET